MTDQKTLREATQIFTELEELTLKVDMLKADLQAVVDELLGDLKYEIEDVEQEFWPKIEEAEKRIKALKRELSALAPRVGETIEGRALKAVLYPARVRVKDEATVMRLAREIPELAAALEIRQPYYVIRRK